MMDQLLYTPEQAGEVLAVGRTTVYSLMASGALASVTIGRCRRIPAEALRVYVEQLAGTEAA
jgi:excisionase family DNA binding protein